MKIKEIKEFVDSYFGIDISSKRRYRYYVDARFMYCKLCYINEFVKEHNSLAKIGAFINRDHASVIHAIKKCDELVQYNLEFKRKFDDLTEKLRVVEFKPVEIKSFKNKELVEMVQVMKRENDMLKANIEQIKDVNKSLINELIKHRVKSYADFGY